MNSMERVMAAIQGQDTDRRPFSLVMSMYGARLAKQPLEAYYTSPELYLQGQKAVHTALAPDILFAPFALALEAGAFGCEIVFLEDNPPNVKKPLFKDLEEAVDMKRPTLGESPQLEYLLESTRLLAQEFGTDVPIAACVSAPVDLPAMLLGVDGWLETLLFQPLVLAAVMEQCTAHFVEYCSALLENGAAFIACPLMFVNPRIVSPDIAEDTVIPLLKTAFAQIPGPIVFHHGGNRLSKFMHLFQGLPNVAAYVLDERDSFTEARQVLGEHTPLLGNISGPHLSKRPPEEIASRTRALLEDRRDDPHFILCTSSADVPWGTPMENLLAVRDTVVNFKG